MYRYVAYDENEQPFTVLETDNGFVCPNLNTNGLAVNQNAGIVGALTIGQDTNVVIYRQTEGTQAEQDMLRVQTPTDGGFAVEQNLWCNALAVNTNAGIVGALTVGSGTGSIVLYRPTSGSQAYQDMLIIQTPTDGGVAVEQSLWCNNLAVNSLAGIGGNLSIGGSRMYLFSSAEQYIEMEIGEAASTNGNLVVGYDRNTDRGYIQMWGIGPLACMQIIGTPAGSHGAISIYKLYYHEMSQFDTLDDLNLAKNYAVKTIIEDDVEKGVIDKESLSFLKADIEDDLWDMGKVTGFMMGCIKALVQRVENLESQIQTATTTGGD